jgi:hypothetical protein
MDMKHTILQKWATRRNFRRYQLLGMTALIEIFFSDSETVLTPVEEGMLNEALIQLKRVNSAWSANNTASRKQYLEK